ncbi:MAG TPA: lytic murein transglycosylase [Balneolaceae bacterium]|nr:lytic murein transglycosylase [Balneolaceae bacterium]
MKLNLNAFALFFSLIIVFFLNSIHANSVNNRISDREMDHYLIESSSDSVDPVETSLSSLIEIFEKKGYDIKKLIEDPRFKIYDGISDRFKKSAERKIEHIDDYKRVLGFDAKKAEIFNFIDENSDQLQNAEETYGISKYVIAAIIGIESDFGKNIGSFNPFNAYVSMYVENYRADFAEAQLLELLEFSKKNKIDILDLKSSYAGAMSYAQFIPYSLNKWFVGSDIFDMDNNIMSIGNYLAYFMERTGTIEKSVFRYNPSSLYTEAVLQLAGEAEEMFTDS